MHFLCVGDPNARPVVILEHGIGETLDIWAWVQERVSNHTYVCSFSRRGCGYSQPGTRPRTVQVTAVELNIALHELNLTAPIVLVGHGWAGFDIRHFYHLYPSQVAALVFVDTYSTQCFDKPKCDSSVKKVDDSGYALLESLIPTGFIRALAYSGVSNPGPAGQCIPFLPIVWGIKKLNPARERFLAALLVPAFWTNAGYEDQDLPTSCAFAAQAPGNSNENKISVPVLSIIADKGIFTDNKICGRELTKGCGGKDKKNRNAFTKSIEIPESNHFTLLCNSTFGYQVANEIVGIVDYLRIYSKTYTSYKAVGKKTWSAAKSFCESISMRLATIQSEDNQNDIGDLDLNSANDDFWLGATDSSSQGTYKWLDGTSVLSLPYQNWVNSNEPSNGPNEDCLQLSKSNHKWSDVDCADLNYVICEKNDF